MYDIAIVGAGPAGATLARLLGQKYKILLLDRRNLNTEYKACSPVKSCGGLVAPDAQKVLAELGLGLPKEVLTGPQLFTVRTIDLEAERERYYQRFYINIDREKFDRWLVSMVPDSVDTRFGCLFRSFEENDQCFSIKYTCEGKEFVEHAKLLVGADGANSTVRKQAFPNHAFPDRYISIQEWFEADEALPYFSAIFDRQVTDFYSWTIPKGDFLIIGSALLPNDGALQKFQLLKKKLREYGFRFDRCVRREGAFILRPRHLCQIFTGTEKIALLGEAAGWISPSSAEGFSYAFRSAMALAGSLQQGDGGFGAIYKANTSSIRRNIMFKNAKAPAMYNPLLRKMIMATGLQSISVDSLGQ